MRSRSCLLSVPARQDSQRSISRAMEIFSGTCSVCVQYLFLLIIIILCARGAIVMSTFFIRTHVAVFVAV